MSIRTITKNVVGSWAGIPAINNTLTELCVLWASGHAGQPCAPALQPLIEDLKQAFPTSNIDGLRPSDMMGGGSIKTVETLISFIASSPSRDLPLALVTTEALTEFDSMRSAAKKGKDEATKRSAKAAVKPAKSSDSR